MRRVLRGVAAARGERAAVFVVGLRVLALTVNILTGLVSAALLGAAGRGELAALLTGPAFLAGISCFGLHAALIYRMKEQPEEASAYFGTSFVLCFVFGLLGAAAGWVLAPHWLQHYGPHTLLLERLLLFALPLTLASWTMSGAAEALGWFTFASSALYLQNIAVLGLLLGLGVAGMISPLSATLAYLAPTLPVFGIFLWRLTPRLRLQGFSTRHAASLMRYGIRLYGVDLLNTCQNYSDQLMAVALLPAHLAGAYVVAQSVARLPSVVAQGVNVVLFPSVAARAQGHVMEKVAVSFRMVVLVSALCAAALALLGPKLLVLAYGQSFAPAAMPLRILLVATVISNGNMVLYQAYAASGRPGFVTLCETLGLGAGLPLMAALASVQGAAGVAEAVLVAAVLRLVLAGFGLGFVLKAPCPRLWPDTGDMRRLGTLLARSAP